MSYMGSAACALIALDCLSKALGGHQFMFSPNWVWAWAIPAIAWAYYAIALWPRAAG